MKFSSLAVGAALGSTATAFPGMKGSAGMDDFHRDLVKRAQNGPAVKRAIAPFPPGLAGTTNGTATKQIKDCLNGAISCENPGAKTYVAPRLGSDECNKDKCCVWDYVVKDLAAMFLDTDTSCNSLARQAIRFGFHDAGSWSLHSGFGGADGSLILSDEINRPENLGMEDIFAVLTQIKNKYDVGAADLAQLASNLGTVVCPLGPRTLTWVGRRDSASSPTDLLPGAFSDANTIFSLFEDKTINAEDLIALIGAHTTSSSNFVDPARPGAFQDTTPGIWDVKYYSETLDANADPSILKFPSDVSLAQDSRGAGFFKSFADANTGQLAWNAAYARAYARISILGVNNVYDLVDCTKVLPGPRGALPAGAGSGKSASSSPASPASTASGSIISRLSASLPTSTSIVRFTNSTLPGTSHPSAIADPVLPPNSNAHTGPDGTYTTTVTQYFTKNGWRIPLATSVCAIDRLPPWARATAIADPLDAMLASANPGDTQLSSVTAAAAAAATAVDEAISGGGLRGGEEGAGAEYGYAVGAMPSPAPTGAPAELPEAFRQGSCVVRTVYTTVTVW